MPPTACGPPRAQSLQLPTGQGCPAGGTLTQLSASHQSPSPGPSPGPQPAGHTPGMLMAFGLVFIKIFNDFQHPKEGPVLPSLPWQPSKSLVTHEVWHPRLSPPRCGALPARTVGVLGAGAAFGLLGRAPPGQGQWPGSGKACLLGECMNRCV